MRLQAKSCVTLSNLCMRVERFRSLPPSLLSLPPLPHYSDLPLKACLLLLLPLERARTASTTMMATMMITINPPMTPPTIPPTLAEAAPTARRDIRETIIPIKLPSVTYYLNYKAMCSYIYSHGRSSLCMREKGSVYTLPHTFLQRFTKNTHTHTHDSEYSINQQHYIL